MAPAPTPVVDPMATLRLDMDAQCKQFELLLKKNSDIVATFAKASVSTNPGSCATPKPEAHRLRTFASAPQEVPQMQEDVHPLSS
jgi:hypothetical protein